MKLKEDKYFFQMMKNYREIQNLKDKKQIHFNYQMSNKILNHHKISTNRIQTIN
jgi:hypothetical protein